MLLAIVGHRHVSLNNYAYRTCYLMLTDIANPTIRLKWLLTQKGLQARSDIHGPMPSGSGSGSKGGWGDG